MRLSINCLRTTQDPRLHSQDSYMRPGRLRRQDAHEHGAGDDQGYPRSAWQSACTLYLYMLQQT